MNQAEEDAPGAIAEVHSDNLRWLISDDDPRRPIAHSLLYTDEAIRAAVAQERERCGEIVGTYQVPVGNSPAGEMACEWTMDALREIAAAIRRGE